MAELRVLSRISEDDQSVPGLSARPGRGLAWLVVLRWGQSIHRQRGKVITVQRVQLEQTDVLMTNGVGVWVLRMEWIDWSFF